MLRDNGTEVNLSFHPHLRCGRNMPGVSLDDRGAWDDSALINSWEEAVAEYEVSFRPTLGFCFAVD